MKNGADDVDLFHTIFAELKHMGVKVPKVKKFKLVLPKQDRCTGKPKNKIFGVYLHEQEWVTGPEGLLPKFIAEATTYLLKYSKEVGLFRKAGSVARQRNLRAKLEDGQDLAGADANDVASLLKQWLRELPEPLIPHCMQDLFIRCHQLGNEDSRITASLLTSLLLPPDHLHTLKHLLCFLEKFAADSNDNKMGASNLALMMAPNIFVSGTEIADKNSNNLVSTNSLHASAIQLLIENADKIGEVPTGVSFHCSLQDGKSGSELDSSGDILDFSPKLRKRRKSGQLQDLLSGIKKLVGQNATPGTNLKMTPEKYCNARVCGPKSASKRKADPDQQASSSVKKQPTLVIHAEDGINVTPKTKDFNTDCKSANRHSRRKSFGLLRRKERKRQKSSKPNCEAKMSLACTHSQNHNNLHENCEPAVQVSSPSNEQRAEVLSPLQCSFEDFLKSVNMKKATSDCYLTPTLRKLSKSPKPTSLSHSRLQDKLQITSPYWFISEKASKTTKQSNATTDEWLQHSNENKPTDLGTAELKAIENASPYETFLTPRRSPRLKVDPSINTSCLPRNNSQEYVTKATPEKKKGSENTTACSLLSDSIHGLNNSMRKRSNSTGTKLTRRAGITRQEAFILKSRNKTDSVENEKKSFQQLENKNDSHFHQKESVSICDDKGISVICLSRNSNRPGSIIRGRPNSVKTGLLSQSFKNKLIVPSLVINETDKPLFKVEIDLNENNPIHNSPLIKHDGQVQDEVNSPDKKDLSLITKFDSFCISPNASTAKIDTDSNTEIKVPSNRKLRSSSNISAEITQKPKRKLSLPSSLDVVPADAGRKMPKLRRSLEHVETIPNDEQKDSSIQGPCGLDASGCFKIPAPSKETTFNISNLEISMNDSCFKTPRPNPSSSPNSITWVSGPKFLGFCSPEEECSPFNKRESIALLLKNKSGHVQEKVNLYDNRIRDSIYCTRSVQSCSTPYIAFSINRNSSHRETTPSHRRLQDSQKSCKSLTKSDSKRNHARGKLNPQKSPLPPPPKFVVTDMDTPSPKTSHPLKEVTNICLGLDESTNSQNNTPGKDGMKRPTQSPRNVNEDNKDACQKHRKLKRNSFSGHTPHTFKKRITRSDSSPCSRQSKKQLGMIQGSAHSSSSVIRK